ncbi:MAG: hypothetical protein WCJ30_13135 [Deltaproteobacteria bacterium]
MRRPLPPRRPRPESGLRRACGVGVLLLACRTAPQAPDGPAVASPSPPVDGRVAVPDATRADGATGPSGRVLAEVIEYQLNSGGPPLQRTLRIEPDGLAHFIRIGSTREAGE